MSIFTLDEVGPQVDPEAWIAPDAAVIGRVALARGVSVWFNAVLRGDTEPIEVGEDANVQDNCVLHTDLGFPLTVGPACTIGHLAILHGCSIGAGSLVGMGATVLNGARIGADSLVGAGALVTEGKEFPDGVLLIGRPAKVARELTAAEREGLVRSAEAYRARAARFRASLRPA